MNKIILRDTKQSRAYTESSHQNVTRDGDLECNIWWQKCQRSEGVRELRGSFVACHDVSRRSGRQEEDKVAASVPSVPVIKPSFEIDAWQRAAAVVQPIYALVNEKRNYPYGTVRRIVNKQGISWPILERPVQK